MNDLTITLGYLVQIGRDMPDLTVRHLAGVLSAIPPAVAVERPDENSEGVPESSPVAEEPAPAPASDVPAGPGTPAVSAGRFTNLWTPDDDERLMRMREDDDRSFAQISKTLGRTERAVEGRFYRLLRARGDDRPAAPAAPPPQAVPAAPEPVVVETVAPVQEAVPATPTPAPAPGPAAAAPVASLGGGSVPLPPREGPKRKVKDAMSFYAARDREVFSAADDYQLLERLSRGERLPQIASNWGVSEAVLAGRARELIPPMLRDRRGHMSIEGRAIALEALRRITHGEQP